MTVSFASLFLSQARHLVANPGTSISVQFIIIQHRWQCSSITFSCPEFWVPFTGAWSFRSTMPCLWILMFWSIQSEGGGKFNGISKLSAVTPGVHQSMSESVEDSYVWIVKVPLWLWSQSSPVSRCRILMFALPVVRWGREGIFKTILILQSDTQPWPTCE